MPIFVWSFLVNNSWFHHPTILQQIHNAASFPVLCLGIVQKPIGGSCGVYLAPHHCFGRPSQVNHSETGEWNLCSDPLGFPKCQADFCRWWLNQPHLKNMIVKLDHVPKVPGEHNKIFELPPPTSSFWWDPETPETPEPPQLSSVSVSQKKPLLCQPACLIWYAMSFCNLFFCTSGGGPNHWCKKLTREMRCDGGSEPLSSASFGNIEGLIYIVPLIQKMRSWRNKIPKLFLKGNFPGAKQQTFTNN